MAMVATQLAPSLDPFYHNHHHYGGHHYQQHNHMNFTSPMSSPQNSYGLQQFQGPYQFGPSSPGNNGPFSSSVRSPPASPSPSPSVSPAVNKQYDPFSYVALDCEFVGVGLDGSVSALARVSIVGFDGSVLYDTFCAPSEKVVDYRSWVSGVREADLLGAPSFQVVQNRVQEILKGKVLVGHAVYNDLEVLGILHPAPCTRDTALYEPMQKLACTSRPSLRALAKLVLSVDVQSGEHSSIEDARVTMAIFRAHQDAWESSLPFPAPVLSKDRSYSPTRPPLQPHQQSQGRPVPVVRFPSNNPSQNQYQQPHRMYSFPMQGSPPPPPLKVGMNPMMDPRFSAAGLALPPPNPPSQQTPPGGHVRRISLQQSPQMYVPPPPPPGMQQYNTPPSPFGAKQDSFKREQFSPRRVPSAPAITTNKSSTSTRSPSPSLSFDSTGASSSSTEDSRQPTPLHPAQRYVVGMPKDNTESAWASLNNKRAKRRGGKRARKESLI